MAVRLAVLSMAVGLVLVMARAFCGRLGRAGPYRIAATNVFFSLSGVQMSRALFIKIHLYLSAFFSVAVILVATSGGLYLLGQKGSVETTRLTVLPGAAALVSEPSKANVLAVLKQAGISDFDFDYVKDRGSVLQTRPTSRPFYQLTISGDTVEVDYVVPSLQKRMMELHMGHGPSAYRLYQQLFAAGMLFIIVSGLWLGLSSPRLRKPTSVAAGSGLLLFVLLALL